MLKNTYKHLPMAAKILPLSFSPIFTNASDKAVLILRGIIKDEITNQVISARMTLYDAEKKMKS